MHKYRETTNDANYDGTSLLGRDPRNLGLLDLTVCTVHCEIYILTADR